MLLPKVSNPGSVTQFRPISLMDQLQKLYTKWLYRLALPFIQDYLGPEQHGFRPGRQAAEILQVCNSLREQHQEWRMGFVLVKLDVARAFDKVFRSKIVKAMTAARIPYRVIWALCRELFQAEVTPEIYGMGAQEAILTERGVKQGAPDSGAVFCLTLEYILRPVKAKWKRLQCGHIIGPEKRQSTHLMFADDLNLVAKNPLEATAMFEDVKIAFQTAGLELNAAKTEFISTFPPSVPHNIPGVNKSGVGMRILGKIVDVRETTDLQMNHRAVLAWQAFNAIRRILSQKTGITHRLRLLQACVVQKYLWTSETWVITQHRLQRMRGLHLKWLKHMFPAPGWIHGLQPKEGIPEHNRHVTQILTSRGFKLMDEIWLSRFWKWAGHAARSSPENPLRWWLDFRDISWWRCQQRLPSGIRHQWWDANLSRWENILDKYSGLQEGWKNCAKYRYDWQRQYQAFLENIQESRTRATTAKRPLEQSHEVDTLVPLNPSQPSTGVRPQKRLPKSRYPHRESPNQSAPLSLHNTVQSQSCNCNSRDQGRGGERGGMDAGRPKSQNAQGLSDEDTPLLQWFAGRNNGKPGRASAAHARQAATTAALGHRQRSQPQNTAGRADRARARQRSRAPRPAAAARPPRACRDASEHIDRPQGAPRPQQAGPRACRRASDHLDRPQGAPRPQAAGPRAHRRASDSLDGPQGAPRPQAAGAHPRAHRRASDSLDRPQGAPRPPAAGQTSTARRGAPRQAHPRRPQAAHRQQGAGATTAAAAFRSTCSTPQYSTPSAASGTPAAATTAPAARTAESGADRYTHPPREMRTNEKPVSGRNQLKW